jgi:hypothetical protein
MKPRDTACAKRSENIANEYPLCLFSIQQSDSNAEIMCGLWRDDRVATMESHHLGRSDVLQCFLPADLSSQGENWIARRSGMPRSVQC